MLISFGEVVLEKFFVLFKMFGFIEDVVELDNMFVGLFVCCC